MSETQPYANIRKVYSVNIVYFDSGQGDAYLYHGTTNFVGTHRGDVLYLNARQARNPTKMLCQGLADG